MTSLFASLDDETISVMGFTFKEKIWLFNEQFFVTSLFASLDDETISVMVYI